MERQKRRGSQGVVIWGYPQISKMNTDGGTATNAQKPQNEVLGEHG
jgi:hypothetical protein